MNVAIHVLVGLVGIPLPRNLHPLVGIATLEALNDG